MHRLVSIQLVSPASGEQESSKMVPTAISISIQLVSPASGEFSIQIHGEIFKHDFHSISFPSEWGDTLPASQDDTVSGGVNFHSISFPSEWGEFVVESLPRAGFSHQIDAPLKYSTGKR
jgi:hypothetical protein